MRSLFTLILALSLGQACVGVVWADDCSDLAKRFAEDRDSLKIGELDDLKTCISDLESDKASGLVQSKTPAYSNAPAASTGGGGGGQEAAVASTSDPVSAPVQSSSNGPDPVSQPIPDAATQPATSPSTSSSP